MLVEKILDKGANILIGCEESQIVCQAFRDLGFYNTFSCDTLETSGNHPEWHLQMDIFEAIKLKKWKMMIAHPPCTYMSKAGARWMYPTAGNLCKDRYDKAMEAKEFFLALLNAPIEYIAIENPTPLKIVGLPVHSQAIQPYQFGHEYSKRTLLWLKNLPPLISTEIMSTYKPYLPSNTGGKKRGQKYYSVSITQKEASKTFSGVAKALAFQYGNLMIKS